VNLSTARTWVRQYARNAGDSSMYSDADIDRAIATVGNRFVRETRCLKTTDSLALTTSSSALPSLPTGFRAERSIRAWVLLAGVAKGTLQFPLHSDLVEAQIRRARTGLPMFIAFDSWTTGEVYPTPDQDYTVKLQWQQFFTTLAPDGSTDGATTLNLPDDWLAEILPYGPTAVLQHNEKEMKYAAETWQKYLDFELRMKDAGNLGAKESIHATGRWEE